MMDKMFILIKTSFYYYNIRTKKCVCIVYVRIVPSPTHGKALETMTKPVAMIILETKQDPMGPSRYKSLSVSTVSCF